MVIIIKSIIKPDVWSHATILILFKDIFKELYYPYGSDIYTPS